MNKKEVSNTHSHKFSITMFIIIGIVLFGFLGYRVYMDFFYSTEREIDNIGLYGYTLKNTDTKLYKTEFKTLEGVLNTNPIDYKEYAKSIAKLFIIDVYNLNNKKASTDIGGLEFLHKSLKSNFSDNMGASLYKYVESNIDGKRTQELPVVSETNIDNVFETKYTYKEIEYDAYIISISWKYEKDLGYETSKKITIIKDNDILYIVKGE